MRPTHFYLVCAGGELDIRVYNPYSVVPDQPPAYAVTEITDQGWETYRVNRWKKRDALPYAEAAHQTLMKCKAGGWPPWLPRWPGGRSKVERYKRKTTNDYEQRSHSPGHGRGRR